MSTSISITHINCRFCRMKPFAWAWSCSWYFLTALIRALHLIVFFLLNVLLRLLQWHASSGLCAWSSHWSMLTTWSQLRLKRVMLVLHLLLLVLVMASIRCDLLLLLLLKHVKHRGRRHRASKCVPLTWYTPWCRVRHHHELLWYSSHSLGRWELWSWWSLGLGRWWRWHHGMLIWFAPWWAHRIRHESSSVSVCLLVVV